MLLSIIIPAFNEEKVLARHLERVHEAMAESSFHPAEWELIVCDNNSTDRTPQIARQLGAKVVFEAHNSIALSRNRGAAAASGSWLLFLDADSYPSTGLMEEVSEVVRQKGFVGGGAAMKFYGRQHVVGRLLLWLANLENRWRQSASGAFTLSIAKAFRELGGFDTRLYVGEDVDFSMRLRDYGRSRNLRMVRWQDHPCMTSPRKFELYGTSKVIESLLSACLRSRAHFEDRSVWPLWYDGRR